MKKTKSEIRKEAMALLEAHPSEIVTMNDPLYLKVIEFLLAPKEPKTRLRCPECHGVISYGSRFCKTCGKKLLAGRNLPDTPYEG